MLDNTPQNLADIVAALRQYHQHNNLPVPPPDGIRIGAGDFCIIEYGLNGKRYGSVKVARGQFELTEATGADGSFHPLLDYNHDDSTAKRYQDYFTALKSDAIYANKAYASRLITLTSEAARSALVLAVLQTQLNFGPNLNDLQWAGMEFCFKNYRHTAAFVGYDIHAGAPNWAPLTADNYLAYIASNGFTGDKQKASDAISALNAY